MKYSTIVIGDELLIGQVTDTNSGWIARHLSPLGWEAKSVKVIAYTYLARADSSRRARKHQAED